MRKILITLLILIVFVATMSILWIFGGQRVSLWADRFGTIASASLPVKQITYEGSGSGGTIHLDDLALSLAPADAHATPPNIGTTKDEQLALSHGGKVFAFGPIRSGSDALTTALPPGDEASISIRHSALSWPTRFDFNFMTGQSPSWKRYLYYRFVWKKQHGAKLEAEWRYEQYFYSGNGWTVAPMTHESVTGLVRVDISGPAR